MANEVEVIPVTVDYTSRDYYALREALIARVKDRVTNWQGTDPNDFGVALIEAFAYMGDVMSYYIDRVANEMSLETASQRESVLNISRMYGYTASGYQSASTTLTIKNTSTAAAITLPAGTQFYGSYDSGDIVVPVIFETDEEVTIPAKTGGVDGSASVVATHGENIALRYEPENGLAGEDLGASNGSGNQTFRLLENQVVDGSVRVFVLRNDSYEEWTQVDNLIEYGASDLVFSSYTDANDYVYVVFGDGVSGKVPPTNTNIKVQYRVGGGSAGRVPADVGFSLFKVPGTSEISAIKSSLVVFNTVGTGGSNPESSTSIRRNAPFTLTALNRAVTLNDYANLTLRSTSIGKANATATTPTSVTVYVAPAAEDDPQDPYPLYDPETYVTAYEANDVSTALNDLVWESVQEDADSELSGKTQIGVSYTVSPPVYTPVEMTIKYTKEIGFTDADIISTIKSILDIQFGYNAMSFEQTLYPEDVEKWIRLTPGVKTASVVEFYRNGATPSRSALSGAANEIFRILSSSVTIQELADDSTPTNITISGTSISFDAGTLEYSFDAGSATSAVLRVYGVPHIIWAYDTESEVLISSSTDHVADIPLVVGTEPLTITCIAEDDVTSTTYTINITRA